MTSWFTNIAVRSIPNQYRKKGGLLKLSFLGRRKETTRKFKPGGYIKKNFSLDLRSLALFRVVVSLILIIDFLFTRLPYFTLFYTDKGLLSLKHLFLYDSFWASTSSLNFISSDSIFQLALLIIAVIFFFMLLVGYKI